MSPLYSEIGRIFDLNASSSDYKQMIEISADVFDECKEKSFTYTMIEKSYVFTFYIMMGCFVIFAIINIGVHMFSVNESSAISLRPHHRRSTWKHV